MLIIGQYGTEDLDLLMGTRGGRMTVQVVQCTIILSLLSQGTTERFPPPRYAS